MIWVADFSPSPESVAAVGTFVSHAAGEMGLSESDTWALRTVVGEMAKGAIFHEASGFRVDLSSQRDRVRVRVYRPGLSPEESADPLVNRRQHDAVLHLVDRLTLRWGVESLEGGSILWAELPTPRSVRHASSASPDALDIDTLKEIARGSSVLTRQQPDLRSA